jgi:long-chain acyl-CoA synthetase
MHEAGEHLAAHASATPDRVAVAMHPSGDVRTYRDVDAASRRLAHVLRSRGLGVGSHIAVLLDNQPEFFDVVWAAQRIGCYVTPINWHLTADEAAYIVSDCDATALVATAKLGEVVAGMADDLDRVTTRISVDGHLAGFESYESVLADVPDDVELDDEREGGWMFYSSGTTGKPKGILPPLLDIELGAPSFLTRLLTGLFRFTSDTVYLSPAPIYHAAPAAWTIGTQRLGGTAVVMERFDPLELLTAIERYSVTHVQLVPTHMIRLLKLTDEERSRYDLSSLQLVVHAAAPCPVEVKKATLDWLGPIVHEFYSGSEGAGFCYIGPEDWLAHPGSVGRSMTGAIHILDDERNDLPAGEEGEVWFETNRTFEYHRDPEKTKAVWDPRGWSWLGDVGRVDEEGYLYLTDRSSNMIISGGVNIYPREIEDVLVMHPAIADVAVLGTPDPDMGEQVTAFVQLSDGGRATEADLIDWCRDRLSHFKCPRSVRFVDALPRLPTGKLLKRLILK